MSERPCPVCGAAESKLLYQQRFDQIADARLLDRYDIVLCGTCGAAFADGIPDQAAFDRYYRDLSKYEGGESGAEAPPPFEPRTDGIAETVQPFISRTDTRILEIGSGHGQLLWALRQRGFSDVLGSDPSPGCARAAQRFYNVPAIAATLFTIPQPPEPYEFLILVGVLEHIRDLDAAVARFQQLLAPSGRVYIEVPDASRLQASMDAPFQEFSVEHINYFSPTSLANTMTRRGFRKVASGRAVRQLHAAASATTWGVYEQSWETPLLVHDDETEIGLTAYIAGCRNEDAHLREKIRRALPEDGRIVVWGVGAHTLRLLATGGLDPAWIAAFVDSNTKYQNRELCGLPVISPEELRGRTEPILISSRGFQHEIHEQIRDRLQLPNPVILLYA